MYQVRVYSPDTLALVDVVWHPLEASARQAESEATANGLVAIVLPLDTVADMYGMEVA